MCLAAPLFAHDTITTKITWTQEISRLVYRHCAACHKEGGAAFSLMTYADARPWAKAIRDEVLNRRMPPWAPVKGIGHFLNDRSLSFPEIETFVGWVEGGAPEGNPAYLPTRITSPPDPVAPVPARAMPLEATLRLTSATTLAGVKVNAPNELWADLPDGTIQRLIWIRNLTPNAPPSYYFRTPIRLPKGATLHTTTPLILYLR